MSDSFRAKFPKQPVEFPNHSFQHKFPNQAVQVAES